MKYIQLLLVIFLMFSCGAHLPKDPYKNHASLGYRTLEFDIKRNNQLKKEFGIANILLIEGEDYKDIDIYLYGIYRGNVRLLSEACSIDTSLNYNGILKINLFSIVPEPKKCSIKILAVTDKIDGKESSIIETGVIKINYIKNKISPLEISYSLNDTFLKNYSYMGQGSLQKSEGNLFDKDKIKITSKTNGGGIYRINGCGFELSDYYTDNTFEISLLDLYKKQSIFPEDSCDFELLVIPNLDEFSHQARFSLNIYGSEVVKLPSIDWEIKKNNIRAIGSDITFICTVNNNFSYKKSENKNVTCESKYDSSKEYYLRSVTSNGRKSVTLIKDGIVIWSFQ